MERDVYQWHCVRCNARTTRAESLGMLSCRYHPHVQGNLKPLQRVRSDNVDVSEAGGCGVCRLSYYGEHLKLQSDLVTLCGCTTIDHLAPGESIELLLGQTPYEVMPVENWFGGQFVAASPYTVNTHVTQRCGFGVSTRSPYFVISSQQQMRDASNHNKPVYLHITLYGPRAEHCGAPESANNGIVLSLKRLYNECADRYGYARIGENDWVRRVTHANRFYLANGDQERGGGSTIASMTVDEVCERELYTDEHHLTEMSTFKPFVIVLRVEARSVRMTSKI